MRHFLHTICFAIAILITQISFAEDAVYEEGYLQEEEIPTCEESAKPLYTDILIYNATEKLKPDHGMIGNSLKANLETMKDSDLSLQEKIHSIYTSFIKCYLYFSAEEEAQLEKELQRAQGEVLQ